MACHNVVPSQECESFKMRWLQSKTVEVRAEKLRRAGFLVDLGYRGRLKRRMKRADKVDARAAVLIGDEELDRQSATVRDLDSGAQESVPFSELETFLARYR